jgi:hypothetical protein
MPRMEPEQATTREWRLRARVAELERVLRMVKADRPSAHSDEVWVAICTALGEDGER